MMWLFVKLNLPSGQSVLSPPWKPHAAQNALIGSVGLTDNHRWVLGQIVEAVWENSGGFLNHPLLLSLVGLVKLTDGGV